jgi:hypothetical protein
MSSTWTKLVNLVIRPPRAEYSPEECLPGPRFRIGGVAHCRRDLELEGGRGLKIQCSHYEPEMRGADQLPCVIYLHGNSGREGAKGVGEAVSTRHTRSTLSAPFDSCGGGTTPHPSTPLSRSPCLFSPVKGCTRAYIVLTLNPKPCSLKP